MRALPLLLWFAACVVPVNNNPPGHNGLAVQLLLEGTVGEDTVTEDTGEVQDVEAEVSIHVDECRFDGNGPEGVITVSDGSDTEIELESGAGLNDLPTLTLLEGTYSNATYTMTLGGSDPAIEIFAALADGQIELTIPGPIELIVATSEFQLPDGPDPVVQFTLEPQRWLDRIDLDQAKLDSDDIAVISPTENADIYAEVLAQLMDDLENVGRFPEPLDDAGGN